MDRRLLAVLAVVVLLVPVVAVHPTGLSQAQEATPPPEPAGVLVEVLGALHPAPGQVQTLLRVTLEPLAELPLHSAPGTTIAYVAAGEVEVTTVAGVTRRTQVGLLVPPATPPALATPIAVVEEAILVVGETVELTAGEAIVYGPEALQTYRNPAAEPAVLLLGGLYAAERPPFLLVPAPATPPAE